MLYIKIFFSTALFNQEEIDGVINYMKVILRNKAHDIKVTDRLEFHPCVVTVQDMASARHFIRTQSHQIDDNLRYSLLQPRLEINPNHPLIKHLIKLKSSDEAIANLLTEQVRSLVFVLLINKLFKNITSMIYIFSYL
jgi:TNF receptor-associated protein 1